MNPNLIKKINSIVTDKLAPGVSYAYLNGGEVTRHLVGDRQWLPQREPLTPGLLYDVASLTKVMGTLTVFLQAMAAGQVQLEERIQEFVPEFTQPTTFRQALTHTSALEGYITNRDQLPAPALKHALLTQLQTTAEVDRQVVYRDVNLLLVGWALENIYHQAIQPLITEKVLRPLALPNATFAPDSKLAVPTTFDQNGLRQGVVHDPKSAILGEHSGAAGLFASLDDFIVFTQYLFGQRQNASFPRWYQQAPRDYTAGLGRSLGWDLRTYHNTPWFYHTGFTGTFWLVQPQAQQALIVLSNRVHPQVNREFLARRNEIVQMTLESASMM